VIRAPQDAARILADHLQGTDREHFVCLMLDTKNRLIGINTVSVGILDSSIVHPREVFKPAIISNAASIVVGHNHPSGDPSPSVEDTRITKRLSEAGEIIGIDLMDHIVIGDGTEPLRWASLKERGVI
jgi:DNA repair protein RadC